MQNSLEYPSWQIEMIDHREHHELLNSPCCPNPVCPTCFACEGAFTGDELHPGPAEDEFGLVVGTKSVGANRYRVIAYGAVTPSIAQHPIVFEDERIACEVAYAISHDPRKWICIVRAMRTAAFYRGDRR
jgi:hypothetical protein